MLGRTTRAALLLLVAGLWCCGGGVASVPASEDAGAMTPPGPSPGGGRDASPDADAQPGAQACATDRDCNADPAISALHGTCFEGVCICSTGYVQPDGKCGPAPPPDCAAHGGTCRQQPASCASGELEGELDTNMSCGDFIAAVCCIEAAACKGPPDLVCCGASAVAYEPRCVNGWKTCTAAAPTPRTRGQGCI